MSRVAAWLNIIAAAFLIGIASALFSDPLPDEIDLPLVTISPGLAPIVLLAIAALLVWTAVQFGFMHNDKGRNDRTESP